MQAAVLDPLFKGTVYQALAVLFSYCQIQRENGTVDRCLHEWNIFPLMTLNLDIPEG